MSDTAKPFDASKAEAFAGTLLQRLNHGAWCLMASIGHRTGLFDTMRELPAATVQDIARAANLNERYIKEWLGAMVTSRVVTVDATSTCTRFRPSTPPHSRGRPAPTTSRCPPSTSRCWAPLRTIVTCFREGGGVPYKSSRAFTPSWPRTRPWSRPWSRVLPLVPGLAEQLSTGIRVLDVGCGSGRVMNRLAELYTNSRFLGIDLSDEAIGAARTESARRRLRNVDFVARDLSDFDATADPAAYELVTSFDAIHDQARPLNVLKGIHRALTPAGVYLMQDIKGSSFVHGNLNHPLGTFLYAVSAMHCMTVSLAQGGEGLGCDVGRRTDAPVPHGRGIRLD